MFSLSFSVSSVWVSFMGSLHDGSGEVVWFGCFVVVFLVGLTSY